MRRVHRFWHGVFDVRPGEGTRTLFLAMHTLFLLFAGWTTAAAVAKLARSSDSWIATCALPAAAELQP